MYVYCTLKIYLLLKYGHGRGQYNPTTTVHTSTTGGTAIRFGPSYIKTLPGILKIIQIVLSVLGLLCITTDGIVLCEFRGSLFNLVPAISFWFTIVLLALHLLYVVEKFYHIPWLIIEYVLCITWSALHLLAACAVTGVNIDHFIAAAVFRFCAMAVYGLDAFLKFNSITCRQSIQGQRVDNRKILFRIPTSRQHY